MNQAGHVLYPIKKQRKMIKVEDTEVMGLRKAIRSMRNASNSWDESTSYMYYPSSDRDYCGGEPEFIIGESDMELAKYLIKTSSPDREFLHMIHVQADVTAPLYWWREASIYKISTTPNNCFPIDTVLKKEFTVNDFSREHLDELPTFALPKSGFQFDRALEGVIDTLNSAREMYLETEDKDYWWQMIQLLPLSFNQLRTIDLDYETLLSIYHQRKDHKLDEWVEFCRWIETLPYMGEFLESDSQTEPRE